MFSEKALDRVKVIEKKINFIELIVKEKGSVICALEDEQNSRASILMHLTSIAEQFDKLLHNGELELLSNFQKQDIKGSYELRNLIVHDCEGIDIDIVKNLINERLHFIQDGVDKILSSENE